MCRSGNFETLMMFTTTINVSTFYSGHFILLLLFDDEDLMIYEPGIL